MHKRVEGKKYHSKGQSYYYNAHLRVAFNALSILRDISLVTIEKIDYVMSA